MTLNAAASKNFAAISSSIAFAEAVLDFALALMRLISTFWHKCNPDFLIIVLFNELCLLYEFFAHFSRVFPHMLYLRKAPCGKL